MMQLSSFMWAAAIFFALVGFLRGWNRELIATAGILLALFAIFQFDSLLRSTIFLAIPLDQVFLVQAGAFLVVTYLVYQTDELDDSDDQSFSESILGGVVGFVNGYLIGGTLWYFLDINEYPIPQFVTAPSLGSPSAESLNWIPIVLAGGGASGTGDALALIVIVLLFVALIAI